MSFVEQLTFGREIAVPARLPMILKQFCKAAIRTQPYDLLKWSSSYFRALADGEEPPIKSRLEYPPPSTASGLTLGFLRVLLRQFGNYNKTLPIETILHRWDCLCLDHRDFDTILAIGRFYHTCQVKKFLAVAVGLLGANLTETMIMICQLFSHEPDGGSAMIPLTLFMEIYEYLAGLACVGNEKDTTERTMCKESSIDHTTCSVNSQDTDVDINLDSELISKDEVDLSKTDLSTELIENSLFEREATNYEEKEDKSLTNQKDDGSIGKDSTDNSDTISKKLCGVKDANSDRSLSSGVEKDTKITCFPNVPETVLELVNEKEIADQNSKQFRSPVDIKGYPKTKHRSSKPRKRRQQSSSKILTASPEKKNLIEKKKRQEKKDKKISKRR